MKHKEDAIKMAKEIEESFESATLDGFRLKRVCIIAVDKILSVCNRNDETHSLYMRTLNYLMNESSYLFDRDLKLMDIVNRRIKYSKEYNDLFEELFNLFNEKYNVEHVKEYIKLEWYFNQDKLKDKITQLKNELIKN